MARFKFFDRREIVKLPKSLGVYVFKSKKEILNAGHSRLLPKTGFLYIGKAKNIQERVKNHFKQPGFKENIFLDKTKKIGFIKTNSEIEALILEAKLIKKYQPKYNVIWKDDKNYFFVGITKDYNPPTTLPPKGRAPDFPRIFITHQPKLHTTNYPPASALNLPARAFGSGRWQAGAGEWRAGKLQTEFVGPFVDGKALKQTLKVLRKVFPYRSCRMLPNRPCLWYQLDRCPAPCLLKSNLGTQIPSARAEIKKECRNNVQNIFKILKGEKNEVLKNLKKEMKKASKFQEFEKASKIRDRIYALERIMSHSKILEEKIETKDWKRINEELKRLLKTGKDFLSIEAYDVSNIQGREATGSMVTFTNGEPNKGFYRKFKVESSGKPNDVAMLKEIMKRRLRHKEWSYPDLILVDGGVSQFNAAKSELKNLKIPIMALAKKKNELFINERKPILLKKLPREIFNLILRLRDESHRFAISYHKKLREVKTFN